MAGTYAREIAYPGFAALTSARNKNKHRDLPP